MDILVITQIITSVAMVGMVYGIMKTQISTIQKDISRLEIKQDKHNSLIERMAVVERDIKSAHNRIDEIHREV